MKLLDNQLDKLSLSKFGEEVCQLFIARDFQELAKSFSYALAYNRDTASAIEADFDYCLSSRNIPQSKYVATVESITVKNFQPNDTGLLSVVECILSVNKNARILIELIVAKDGENKNLYLEDMNAVD